MRTFLFIFLCLISLKTAYAYDEKATEELQNFLDEAMTKQRSLKVLDKKPFFESVLSLLNEGADPNVECKINSCAVIHFAIQHHEIPVIRRYFETGGKLQIPSKQILSPLAKAILARDYEIIFLLLSYGANMHERSDNGLNDPTIQLVSVRFGEDKKKEFKIFNKYAARGSGSGQIQLSDLSSFKFKDYKAVDTMTKAIADRKNKKLIEFLEKLSDCGQNPIHTAVVICWHPDLPHKLDLLPIVLQFYKKHKKLHEKINALDNEGRTPLLLAMINRKEGAARELIKNGAQIMWLSRGPNVLYLAYVVPEFQVCNMPYNDSLAQCIFREFFGDYYSFFISAKENQLQKEIIRPILFLVRQLHIREPQGTASAKQ